MPRYEFTTGQVLTAGELNDVSDQTVMTFAGTAARGSAIPSPVEGMVTYLEDADELQVYTTSWGSVGGGKILQVLSTSKTDTFTTTSTSFIDVTSFSVSITPTSATSKVFVIVNAHINGSGSQSAHVQLLRNSTAISIGAASGSRTPVSASANGDSTYNTDYTAYAGAISFLDSPATTSAVTYKLQMRSSAGNEVRFNRGRDTDAAISPRVASNITVMEVAG